MTGALSRYHARSPRYTLNTQDNSLIRYFGAQRSSWEEKTELKNLSLTGLSFTAAQDLSPQLGEVIKIQFQVPGSEMMACYAVVIRIAAIDDIENEIAVHFYKLDRIQRINLVQGLAQKIDRDLQTPQHEKNSKPPKDLTLPLILMMVSICSWLLIMKLVLL